MKIIGDTVGNPTPRTNWEQTDHTMADYLEGRDALEMLIQNAQTAAGYAQTAANNYTDEQVKHARPWNALDNSYFRDLIAQDGISGKQGTVTYAADRWILQSGTVSYTKGVGLTLDGTIVQTLGTTVTEGSAFVGVASGTADISFDASQNKVTITSNGGVLIWAALYPGVYTEATRPEYQPKGYEQEALACKRFFRRYPYWQLLGTAVVDWEGNLYIFLPVESNMYAKPTPSAVDGQVVTKSGAYVAINRVPTSVTMLETSVVLFFAKDGSLNDKSGPCGILLGGNNFTLSVNL